MTLTPFYEMDENTKDHIRHISPAHELVAKPPKTKFLPSLTTLTIVNVGTLSSHLA